MSTKIEEFEVFATVLNCMDGRVQRLAREWIERAWGVDFVDAITRPGMDKYIVEHGINDLLSQELKVSIKVHSSKVIVVAGHSGCAGNPEDKRGHYSTIRKAVEIVDKWCGNNFFQDIEVLGTWIEKTGNGKWTVRRITEFKGDS